MWVSRERWKHLFSITLIFLFHCRMFRKMREATKGNITRPYFSWPQSWVTFGGHMSPTDVPLVYDHWHWKSLHQILPPGPCQDHHRIQGSEWKRSVTGTLRDTQEGSVTGWGTWGAVFLSRACLLGLLSWTTDSGAVSLEGTEGIQWGSRLRGRHRREASWELRHRAGEAKEPEERAEGHRPGSPGGGR